MTTNQQIPHACAICRDIPLSPRDFVRDSILMDDISYYPLGQFKDIAAEKTCPLSRLFVESLAKEGIDLTPDTPCRLKWDDYYSSDTTRIRNTRTRCLYLSYGSSETWGPRFVLLAEDAPLEYSFGRIFDSDIDAGLLRNWLSLCDEWHGGECSEQIFPEIDGPWSLTSFLLVDVKLKCIVHQTSPARYLALSYVWGSAPSLQLSQSNFRDMQEPGAFGQSNILSNTVGDAITLTEMLGERYLWVDQLCIIQDDVTNKQTAISNMDKIYAHAELTIVAAAGSSAKVGLPGVNGRPRARQIVARVSEGVRLMYTPKWPDELDRSYYETRAWTFQERVLSRRCLFFLEDHAIFRCRNATWRENLVCESPKLRHRDGQVIWQYGAVGTQVNQRLPSEDFRREQRYMHPLRDYTHAMNEYSIRKLSFESDAMNACEGILKQIATTMGFDLLYCIPRQFLELGLLWYGGEERRPGFPSWSWIGWKGRTWLGLEIPRRGVIMWWLSTDCWISWHNMKGDRLHLATLEETGEYLPDDLFKQPPDIDKKLTVPWNPLPTFVPQDYYLRFWTFSFQLKISHAVKLREERFQRDASITKWASIFDLRDRNELFAGRLLSHAHSGKGPRDPRVELLVICRQRWHSLDDFPPGENDFHLFLGFEDGFTHPRPDLEAVQLTDFESGVELDDASAQTAMRSYPKKPDQRPGRFYDVLEITWREDGVAERTGIGRVLTTAVEGSFDPGVTWKEIVLG